MALFFNRTPSSTSANPDQEAGVAIVKLAKMARFTIFTALTLLAIWLIGDVLMVLFASALVAVVLNGLARMLRRHLPFIPYQLAVGLVALAILLILTALFWPSGPGIWEQFLTLKAALISQLTDLRLHLSQSSVGKTILDHVPTALGGNDRIGLGSNIGFGGLAGSLTGLLSSAFGLIATLLVILIAAFYFALSPSLYINGFLRLVPPAYRKNARMLLCTAGSTLWAWTAGQALDMLVVGLLSGIGLGLLGVPLAFALGAVAGLCNFIPYIGAFLGAVPALIIALSVSTQEVLFVAILYCVIQFCEGNIFGPLIQRRAVHMPPALAILSQTVCSSILGVPGLVLASPLTAALLAVFGKALPPLADPQTTLVETAEMRPEELAAATAKKGAAKPASKSAVRAASESDGADSGKPV
ncbi:AI-2E family transporter [Oecophyllibacter saccharovorans]|uniref:AI-2E family transporter n=1 Tax=Oecophyllibacter saccharovorans TaxID=2558360 RepID=UPI001144EE46|nr:AI-2E family transporter [Oecophyllibacter saccharovorans]